MMQNHQYLVWWVSSVAGESFETFNHPARAQQRLDELEEREYFLRGAVIDTTEATQTEDEFRQIHNNYAKRKA